MSAIRRAKRVLCIIVVIASLTCCTGCLSMIYAYGEMETKLQDRFAPRSYTEVQFQVVDGDTLQPLAGVDVGVNNCAMYDWFRDDSSGKTDHEGRVTLRVIRDRTPSVGVSAEGYMPVPARERTLGAEPPPSRVLHLYSEPRPFHVLQIPARFEGTIQVHVRNESDPMQRATPRHWPNWQPRDRGFVTQLNPSARNDLTPLPDMGLTPQDSQAICGAQWSDGSPLLIWYHHRFQSPPPQSAPTTQPAFDASTVAMWELGYRAGLYYFFYVGTLQDARVEQTRLETTESKFYLAKLPER